MDIYVASNAVIQYNKDTWFAIYGMRDGKFEGLGFRSIPKGESLSGLYLDTTISHNSIIYHSDKIPSKHYNEDSLKEFLSAATLILPPE